jgi:predicted nucleic acid-binding protein
MRKFVTLLISTGLLAGALAGSAHAQTTGPPPLTDRQSNALLPVIDYAQILDASKPSPVKLARYTGACRKLPLTDKLIAAFRATCRAEGDAFTAGLRLPNCRSTDRCRVRLTRYVSDLGKQAVAARRWNVVIKTAIPDTDCRRVLRTSSAILRTIARLQSGAKAVVTAISTGSTDRVNAAVARFYGIDRSALLDHRGRLDSFRAACR